MKITSAYANKLLKSLADEKSYWEAQEASSRTYVAAVGEEPVIPKYDYSAVSETLKRNRPKSRHHQARPEPGQCHRKDHGRRYGNECRQHSGKNGTT